MTINDDDDDVCYPHHSVPLYLQLTPIYLANFVHYIVYTKNTH
jgi:hypothetical protein